MKDGFSIKDRQSVINQNNGLKEMTRKERFLLKSILIITSCLTLLTMKKDMMYQELKQFKTIMTLDSN